MWPWYSTFFGQLGKLIKWTNTWIGAQNTLISAPTTGQADDVLTEFNAYRDLAPNFQIQCDGEVQTLASFVAPLTGIATAGMFPFYQGSLNSPSSSPTTFLAALGAQMIVDSQTIHANTISAPSIIAGGSNHGNGQLLASNLNRDTGVNDQRIISETIVLRCTLDQWNGGRAGAEQFSLTGLPALQPALYGTRGSGNGPNVIVADSANIITNGNFETWSGSPLAPSGWTINNGTAGTNILQGTTVHAGSYSLELFSGVAATIDLTQNLSAVGLRANTVYMIGVWVRKAGTVGAGSTLTISINGTGVTTQTIVSLDPSTLTTSYVFYNVKYASGGTVPPSDYQIQVHWASASTAGAGAIIYVDDCVLVKPVSFGYASWALFEGSIPFEAGDTFTVTQTTDGAGITQTYLGRFFNAYLPSSLTPTIPDYYDT